MATDALALMVTALIVGLPLVWHVEPWVTTPLFPPCCCLAWRRRSVTGTALSSPAMVYLGDISVSIYLVHWGIITLVHVALLRLGMVNSFPILLVAVVPATILLSGLTYRRIERPARRLLRQHLDPRDMPEPKMAVSSF